MSTVSFGQLLPKFKPSFYEKTLVKLGEGGFGKVWKYKLKDDTAEDEKQWLPKEVAVKRAKMSEVRSEREYLILSECGGHPCILQLQKVV